MDQYCANDIFETMLDVVYRTATCVYLPQRMFYQIKVIPDTSYSNMVISCFQIPMFFLLRYLFNLYLPLEI